MKDGKTITFIELFDEVGRIEIPIIQRDYAQGRIEAIEVREQFLDAIKNNLLTPHNHLIQPLDLDFIYGNFEGGNSEVFSVLDGQQRLTTLFLIHWCLAVKFDHIEEFRDTFVDARHSRFTYKTRPSTSEFFDALVNSSISNEQILEGDLLSKFIQNKQWFFLSWKQDPTVQSCLRMIDAIYQLFDDCEDDLYVRLTRKDTPYITFQYLNLQSFGLSDELYIKMNARGKPLTNFENFKAWLFSRINGFVLAEQFEKHVDQQWTDVFWQMSLEGKDQFDELYLRFFYLMAFYSFCERVESSFVLLEQPQKKWLREIRVSKGYISHRIFEKYDVFTFKDIECISCVLDYISACKNTSNMELIHGVLKGSDYVAQAQFYALVLFIKNAPNISDWDETTYSHMERWIRITNNLIHNFRLDELSPFIPTIRALTKLSDHCFDLYEFLSGEDFEYSGFTKSQWYEESLKAKLILKDNQWEALLVKYENHIYLHGKVGFLLDMVALNGNYSIENFEKCSNTAAVLLSDEILKSDEFLLQRALLSLDDYLIYVGSNVYSFGIHNRGSYRERSENWLSVVSKPSFEKLINIIGNNDVRESLQLIISNVNCGGWRELIVKNPNVITYCRNRLIHKDNNQVYLLTLSNFRGKHSELRTFILEKRLKQIYKDTSLPHGIEMFSYKVVYGKKSPGILFNLSDNRIYRLGYDGKKYRVFEERMDSYDMHDELVENAVDMPSELAEMLVEFLDGDELMKVV